MAYYPHRVHSEREPRLQLMRLWLLLLLSLLLSLLLEEKLVRHNQNHYRGNQQNNSPKYIMSL